MRYAPILFLLLFSLTATAQSKRVYYVGTGQIAIENADGSGSVLQSASGVRITATASSIVVNYGTEGKVLDPAQFLDKTGLAYSTVSAQAAKDAFYATAPTGGGGSGTTSVTVSQTATLGSSLPIVTDYTASSGAISLTSIMKVLIENIGSAAGSFTYGGNTYALAVGDQRLFAVEPDPSDRSKLIPIPAITVNGTGTTIRLIKYPKQ